MISGGCYDRDDIVMDTMDRMSYIIMRCSTMRANAVL